MARRNDGNVKRVLKILETINPPRREKKGDGSHAKGPKVNLWKEKKTKKRQEEQARLEEKWRNFGLIFPLSPKKKIIPLSDLSDNGKLVFPAIPVDEKPVLKEGGWIASEKIPADPAEFVRKEFRKRYHAAFYGHGHSCPECDQ